MLVLSRKPFQRIVIGEDIRITVVALDGGRVRLGIEAPPQVSVLRGELIVREDGPSPSGEDEDEGGPGGGTPKG